jgi:hypothetical protein
MALTQVASVVLPACAARSGTVTRSAALSARIQTPQTVILDCFRDGPQPRIELAPPATEGGFAQDDRYPLKKPLVRHRLVPELSWKEAHRRIACNLALRARDGHVKSRLHMTDFTNS